MYILYSIYLFIKIYILFYVHLTDEKTYGQSQMISLSL